MTHPLWTTNNPRADAEQLHQARAPVEMILAARETLGGHTNSGLLPRALAEMAARETFGGHTNSGMLPRALAELIHPGQPPTGADGRQRPGAEGPAHWVSLFFLALRRLNFTPSLKR